MKNAILKAVVFAGLGGGAVLALPFVTRGPAQAGAPSVVSRPLPFDPTARMPHGGLDAGGGESGVGIGCQHQNFQKDLVDLFIASQKDPNFPFWIETADDFFFFDPDDPNGLNGCVLDSIVTGFAFFNCGDVDGDGDNDQDDCVAAGLNPANCWSGVKVTIYQDISAGVPNTSDPGCKLPKQPAGYPGQVIPPRDHIDCFLPGGPSGILCELKVPMSKVTVTANPALAPAAWDVSISGLKQFNCVLQKNRKYWIAVAPEQDISICAQTGIYVHPRSLDHEAMIYFPFFPPPVQWRPLSTVLPDGLHRDVAIDVVANKELEPCTFFLDKGEFESFNAAHGKVLKGIEDFEESNVPAGGAAVLPAPLQSNVPNVDTAGLGFPGGLTQKNIIIQDNIFPGPNPPDPLPSGEDTALFVIGTGAGGSNSEKVGENLWAQGIPASLDLIFTEPNHTGVGFELSCLVGFPNFGWHITVYDKINGEIGKFFVPAGPAEPSKTFFGVWCPQTIGRINIFYVFGPAPDTIDDIQMWEEQPHCPWDCANSDRTIDILDFLALLAGWGFPGPCDFDGDGAVDINDFLKLLAHWGVPPECEQPGGVRCFDQPPNQLSAAASDVDCGDPFFCPTGIEVLAEQVVLAAAESIDALRFWGGYFPDDAGGGDPPADDFTVKIRENAGVLPGAVIRKVHIGPATSRVETGVILSGGTADFREFEYVIDLEPNQDLEPGIYWVEIYNDTSAGPPGDDWFWETGDLDAAAGLAGIASSVDLPNSAGKVWIPLLDPNFNLALNITCKLP